MPTLTPDPDHSLRAAFARLRAADAREAPVFAVPDPPSAPVRPHLSLTALAVRLALPAAAAACLAVWGIRSRPAVPEPLALPDAPLLADSRSGDWLPLGRSFLSRETAATDSLLPPPVLTLFP